MPSKLPVRVAKLSFLALFFAVGCLSEAEPTVSDSGVPESPATVDDAGTAPDAESAQAARDEPKVTSAIDPDKHLVPVSEIVAAQAASDHNPWATAYASDMSANGWYFEGESQAEDGAQVESEVESAGDASVGGEGDAGTRRHRRSRKLTQQLIDDDGPFEPDPTDEEDLYGAYVSYATLTQVNVELRCNVSTGGRLSRRVNDGAAEDLGRVQCKSNYFDKAVKAGTKYCYTLKADGMANAESSCRQTPFQPYMLPKGAQVPAISSALVKAFDWRQTNSVYAGTASEPTLWYVNILTDYYYDVQALRDMGIHTQDLPLFQEEQHDWNPGDDNVLVDGKFVGRWTYALVPGSVYNDMRTQMIKALNEGKKPGFLFAFRELPVENAKVWTNNAPFPTPVKIEYVGQMGVAYNGTTSCGATPGPDGGEPICAKSQALGGWLWRKAYHWVTNFIDEVVEGVRKIIGKIVCLIKGDITLKIKLKLMNTDAEFAKAAEVRSAWRNQPLVLRNVNVQITQGLALFEGRTNDKGEVDIKVAKGWNGSVYVELENGDLLFTEGFAEATAKVSELAGSNNSHDMPIEVRHGAVNAFATMTDARDYVREVLKHDMPKVTVMIGWAADHASGGPSFSPCMGMAPVLTSEVISLGAAVLLPVGLPVAELIEAFYSVDIILKSKDMGRRGVSVHEYGHAVMCSMMRSASQVAAETAMLDILKGYKQGDRKDPHKEQNYLTEGLADFLMLQVAGGTDYVSPPGGYLTTDDGEHYCIAAGGCFETNEHGNADDWDAQMRRVLRTLQDTFDKKSTSSVLEINDGSHWVHDGNYFKPMVANDSTKSDDTLELSGGLLKDVYRRWAARSNTLREASFFGALGETLLEAKYSHRDICEMFKAHSPNNVCPDYIQNLDTYCPAFDKNDVRAGFCQAGCCKAGEGECSSDAMCAPGFYCQKDNGALYGLKASLDLCTRDEQLSVKLQKPTGKTLNVTFDKGSMSCSNDLCSANIAHGETVTITASTAVGWQGCTVVSSTKCKVIMNGLISARATIPGEQPEPPETDEPPICKIKPNLPQCQPDQI